MKTINQRAGILLVILFLSLIGPEKALAQESRVNYNLFYTELSPYGQWIDYPQLGQVWIPDAGTDFVPYSTNGYWVFSNYGWTWVSEYDWGWAPFHYGRWDYVKRYGWIWIPGYEWGPSWVIWRSADGYYGWAPMGSGLSINGSLGRQFNHPSDHWIFVRNQDIHRNNIHSYQLNTRDQDQVLRKSQLIRRVGTNSNGDRKYISGPSREDVVRQTGVNISPQRIGEKVTPRQNVQRNGVNTNQQRVTPQQTEPRNRVNTNSQRVTPQQTEPRNRVNTNSQKAAPQQNVQRNGVNTNSQRVTPQQTEPSNRVNANQQKVEPSTKVETRSTGAPTRSTAAPSKSKKSKDESKDESSKESKRTSNQRK